MPNFWDRVQYCLRCRRADQHSGPVWWAYAIFLLAIALLILLAAITLLVVKPKLPNITVQSHLNVFQYDPNQGRLVVELSISTVFENHNSMVELVFSQVNFHLRFNGTPLMTLSSVDLFEVPRKKSLPHYYIKRVAIPFDHAGWAAVEGAISHEERTGAAHARRGGQDTMEDGPSGYEVMDTPFLRHVVSLAERHLGRHRLQYVV